MKKYSHIFISICFLSGLYSQCDSTYTYYSGLPSNVSILVGDTCLFNNDIEVLDSLIYINSLDYNSPLELGTQTWFNGRLRFLVAGNYGNSSGVNDTIYVLPENIGNWTGMASLYLEWNRISSLPESFSDMEGLQSFYINNNVITSLGDSIGNLSNLYFLDLGYNELASIPESFCNLTNLNYLWLFNNNLESLPDCFCGLDLDWDNDDNGGYPYFAIGANMLCDNVDTCVTESEHFELSLDQFYYSFPVYSPQDCDSVSIWANPFPFQYQISQPYPNPFNPVAKLDLTIPFDRKMDIRVFDLLGQELDVISNGEIYKSGIHQISWDGKKYSSGMYFIKINDGIDMQVRKMILIK